MAFGDPNRLYLTLCDSNRPYNFLLIPKLQLPLQPFLSRGTFAAPFIFSHSSAFHRTDIAAHPARPRTDSPAFYRTNFARAPARQSDGLTFGIPSPAFPRTDFARIRKADADSTISQPRYGRNQPPLNHEPTILRVESKNDFDTTIPHPRSLNRQHRATWPWLVHQLPWPPRRFLHHPRREGDRQAAGNGNERR